MFGVKSINFITETIAGQLCVCVCVFKGRGANGLLSGTHQPECSVSKDLDSDQELMVRHVQDDLVLRDQDTPTAVGVWTE